MPGVEGHWEGSPWGGEPVGRGEGCGGVPCWEGRAGTLALLAGGEGVGRELEAGDRAKRAAEEQVTVGGSGEERTEGGDLGFLQTDLGQPNLALWLFWGAWAWRGHSSASLPPPTIHEVTHRPIRWSPLEGSLWGHIYFTL